MRQMCAPLTTERLSRNCGVVTLRAVRGVLLKGALIELKVKGGTSGKRGSASPCVKRKSKRAYPAVNSLMTRGESTRR